MDSLLYVHIPQTGATVFSQWLEIIYKDNFHQILTGQDITPHGHYRFSDLDDVASDTKLVIWLRDPVERIISHYYSYKNEQYRDDPLWHKIQDDNYTLYHFVRETDLCNLMAKQLNGHDIERFDFVGITEHYNQSMALFAQIMGIRPPILEHRSSRTKWDKFKKSYNKRFNKDIAYLPIPHINRNFAFTKYIITDQIRAIIIKNNLADMILYRRGVKHFKQLCDEYV